MNEALRPRATVTAEAGFIGSAVENTTIAENALSEAKATIAALGAIGCHAKSLDESINPEDLHSISLMLIRHLNTAQQNIDMLWEKYRELNLSQ